MASFIIHSHTATDWVGLAFDSSDDRLICTDVSRGVPDLVVHAFDPMRDVFYRTPERLSSEELRAEVAIHFPQSLASKISTVFPSTLGHTVLMQCVGHEAPLFSPLAALGALVDKIGSVNSAILQADNNGLLFVRQAGETFEAHASARGLEDFLNLKRKERDVEFPDFDSTELLLSGSDLLATESERLRDEPLTISRRLTLSDLAGVCDFTEAAATTLAGKEPQYTLALGAALAYHEIRKASR